MSEHVQSLFQWSRSLEKPPLSSPIVGLVDASNLSVVKRSNSELLPTLESPTSSTCSASHCTRHHAVIWKRYSMRVITERQPRRMPACPLSSGRAEHLH